jgi:hypothetical protein
MDNKWFHVLFVNPGPDIGKSTGYSRGSSHNGADKVRSSAASLPTFKVSVAG